jgi:DNA (cytosine-5)-methyltransferase 1
MHRLPLTYRPLEGDPVDLRNLYQPTFSEFSLIGGFPPDWRWPNPIPKGKRQTKEEMMAGEREGFLMLANAVPPPLAHAIGRAIIDHHGRRVPAVEAVNRRQAHWVHELNKRTKNFRKLQRYRQWLAVGKRKQTAAVRQAITDLRKAKLLLSGHGLTSAKEDLVAFDKLAATPKMIGSRRSQLRRALRDLAEFENYQSYVEAELFADDDEAYARDFLDYYGPNAGQFEEAEQPAPPPPDFMKRREQDRPPQP